MQSLTYDFLFLFSELQTSWHYSSEKWDDKARRSITKDCWDPLLDAVSKQKRDLEIFEKALSKIESELKNINIIY